MEIVRTPMHSPAAWRGRDERHNQDWIYQLSDDEVADLDATLAQVARSGKTLDTLQRADFPLPRLQPAIARWITEPVADLADRGA